MATINLNELIERLEDIRNELTSFADDEDVAYDAAMEVEVMIAYQPRWPLQLNIGQIVLHENEDGVKTVYITENSNDSNSYLDWDIARDLGWKM